MNQKFQLQVNQLRDFSTRSYVNKLFTPEASIVVVVGDSQLAGYHTLLRHDVTTPSTWSKHSHWLFAMHLSAHWIASTREFSRSPASADNLDATLRESESVNLANKVEARRRSPEICNLVEISSFQITSLLVHPYRLC